jgi:hypothetical protein
MTDRFNALTVSLDRDIRDDDAEIIINAIKAIRGVVGVTGNIVDADSYVATSRARQKVTEKLYDCIKELNNL